MKRNHRCDHCLKARAIDAMKQDPNRGMQAIGRDLNVSLSELFRAMSYPADHTEEE